MMYRQDIENEVIDYIRIVCSTVLRSFDTL